LNKIRQLLNFLTECLLSNILHSFFQEQQVLDASLPESAAALEKKYVSVEQEKEELEAKLYKAITLREKISQLKSSKYFLLQNDLSRLDNEMSFQRSLIHNSLVAESEIRMHEEIIAKIKSSGRIISPSDKAQIRIRIEAMQEPITKAHQIQEDICKAEEDSGFCSEAEIEKLLTELDVAQNVFKKLHSLNPGNTYTVMM